MKKRLLLVYSNLVWEDQIIPVLCRRLSDAGLEVHFLILNDVAGSKFEETISKAGFEVHRIQVKSKRCYPYAIARSIALMKRIRPDIVHTNLLDANLIGLFSAWLVGIKKRIYTRHHSDFFHQYHPHAVFYDKACNWLATDIIAISENVRKVLREMDRADPEKISLVYHGFEAERFEKVQPELVEEIRKKYGIPDRRPVIGVFSRYTEWKGVQYIIPAFKELLKTSPHAFFLFANAFPSAYRKNVLRPLFEQLPPGSYGEIESEPNVQALYQCLDVFVHVPINETCEAFGMVYVEALLAGVPSIFTLSGIASEFVVPGKNACSVGFKSSSDIHTQLLRVLGDESFREGLQREGRQSVKERFSFDRYISSLLDVYR